MSQALERRYRRLLGLYPKAYREERGAEILATLMDAAEHNPTRPAGREVAALVVGAAQTRMRALATRSPADVWLSGLRVAVLVLVAHAAAQSAANVVINLLVAGRDRFVSFELGSLAALIASVLALLAIARGRYGLGVILAGAAFGFGLWAKSGWPPSSYGTGWPGRWAGDLADGYGELCQLPVAIVLTLPLFLGRPVKARRPLTWLLLIPPAMLLGTEFSRIMFDTSRGDVFWLPSTWVLALGVGCLAWLIIDTRASVIGAVVQLPPSLSMLLFLSLDPGDQQAEWLRADLSAYLLMAAFLVCLGAILIYRRTRAYRARDRETSPPHSISQA